MFPALVEVESEMTEKLGHDNAPLSLTDRDITIGWGVYDFLLLTSRQIRRMYFGDRPGTAASCSRRMKVLKDAGLVQVLHRQGDHRNFYTAGHEALTEIAEHEGLQRAAFWRRHSQRVNAALASRHFQAVTDLWSYFILAEHLDLGELVDYSLEPETRFDFKFNSGAGIERTVLIPDGRGIWHDNRSGRDVHFLIEVDRGTERLEQIKLKVEKYLRLLLRLGWAQQGGRPCFPLVMFVTRTPRRAASIAGCFAAACRGVGVLPQDVNRFATFAVSDARSIDSRGITSDIWNVPLEPLGTNRPFDILLPSNHMCCDLRRYSSVTNPRWSRSVAS